MKALTVLTTTATATVLLFAAISDASSSFAYYNVPGLPGLPALRVYSSPRVYSAHSSSVLTPLQQQYHTQDAFGQYAYGYNEPLSAKEEIRSLDGVTRGAYSYRDAKGELQTVRYTADDNGFRVAATNLPRPVAVPAIRAKDAPATAALAVADTVEVAAARTAHFAAHQKAKLHLADDESGTLATATGNIQSLAMPQPVEDTPVVAAAKASHLKRIEQETLRNEILAGGTTLTPVVRHIIPYNTYNYPQLISGYYY